MDGDNDGDNDDDNVDDDIDDNDNKLIFHLLHALPLIFIFINLLVYSDHLINNFSMVHLLKLSLAC